MVSYLSSQTDKIEQQLINWDFPTSQEDREAPLIADLMDGTTSNGDDADSVSVHTKRIAFLFDSTLTAFLMMGNLSPVSISQLYKLVSNCPHVAEHSNTV